MTERCGKYHCSRKSLKITRIVFVLSPFFKICRSVVTMNENKATIRLILTGICLIIAFGVDAQRIKLKHLTTFDDKVLHFGFSLGLNTLDFDVRNYVPIGENRNYTYDPFWDPQISRNDTVTADVANLIPGFTVGIISNLRISRYLDLRFLPGMSFGERKLTYNIPVIDNYYELKEVQYDYSIKSTFLDFPLLLKYKASRINNGSPYVVFGGAMRIDISKSAVVDLVGLTRTGYYAELGAGWDTYLMFFRLSVEAKVSLGLNNQLGRAPDNTQRKYYSESIKSLKSNIFTLSFHFE